MKSPALDNLEQSIADTQLTLSKLQEYNRQLNRCLDNRIEHTWRLLDENDDLLNRINALIEQRNCAESEAWQDKVKARSFEQYYRACSKALEEQEIRYLNGFLINAAFASFGVLIGMVLA